MSNNMTELERVELNLWMIEKRRIIIKKLFIIVVIAFSGSLLFKGFIKPEYTYWKAVEFYKDGNYGEAWRMFGKMDWYKDSRKYIAKCDWDTVKIGDIIKFGGYKEIGNNLNEIENIEWRVLDIKDGCALLITERIIDYHKFNISQDVTWENSVIRKWLNRKVYYWLFTEEERERIVDTPILTKDNSKYNTDGGKISIDKLFLPETEEIEKYYDIEEDRRAYVNDYRYPKDSTKDRCDSWWTRTSGMDNKHTCIVDSEGRISPDGVNVNIRSGVRPAMWVELKVND